MTDLPLAPARPFPLFVLALVAAEIVTIAIVLQFAVDFDCRAADAYTACMAVRNSLGRGMALLAVVALMPALRAAVRNPPPRRPGPWPAVQLAGVGLILLPALASGDFAPTFRASLPLWGAGAAMAAAGTLLWLAPASHWSRLARPHCLVPIALALAAPEILGLADGLWRGGALPDLTFALVGRLLAPFGEVEIFPPDRVVRLDEFAIEVAGPCSGMEGVALITALLATHVWIHRRELRWPFALTLFPIAVASSLALNVLRIGALVLIGARVSPELAVNGFHSHAGWLAFTLLAFALIALSRLPVFRAGAEPHAAACRDGDAALILPFVATMLGVLAIDTFAPDPAAWYPLRVVVMLVALLPFVRTWARLGAPSSAAVALGLAVGAGWLLTATAHEPASQGIAIRMLGAVFLTPLVEEAFFRGYLQPRLIRAGLPPALAMAAAAGLFGLLHGRWLAGSLAGAAFGLAAFHRGRLSDAVAAHVAANATLVAWGLVTGNWSV